MKTNMGKFDKTIRVIISLLILAAYYFKLISGTTAIILLAISLIFLLTSILGFCPMYSVFGFSTNNKQNNE